MKVKSALKAEGSGNQKQPVLCSSLTKCISWIYPIHLKEISLRIILNAIFMLLYSESKQSSCQSNEVLNNKKCTQMFSNEM